MNTNLGSSIIETEKKYTSGLYAKRDLTIVRGEGATLIDDQGNEFIDCVGGQGAANLGHAHPLVSEAIAQQAGKLISCPETFYNDQRAELLERLIAVSPQGLNRVYLCNSGTEAIEAAIKFARYSTQRTRILATMRGFHGRTLGALSATWDKKYRKPFEPLVPDFAHVPFNNLEKLEKALNQETAAFIVEVVQGEGGVHVGEPGFLKGAQKLCHERNVLFVVDEVQTGFGRTGKMFAVEHFDLKPDIMTVAKSFAGGVPIGATLLGSRVRDLAPGLHGSTFGGNPLSCAAGIAALSVLENENLAEKAADTGDYLMKRLQAIDSPLIRDIRGLGLMVGIEIRYKVAPYLSALMERGVLALSGGLTVIRLLPPLVITYEQVDRVVAAIDVVLQN